MSAQPVHMEPSSCARSVDYRIVVPTGPRFLNVSGRWGYRIEQVQHWRGQQKESFLTLHHRGEFFSGDILFTLVWRDGRGKHCELAVRLAPEETVSHLWFEGAKEILIVWEEIKDE